MEQRKKKRWLLRLIQLRNSPKFYISKPKFLPFPLYFSYFLTFSLFFHSSISFYHLFSSSFLSHLSPSLALFSLFHSPLFRFVVKCAIVVLQKRRDKIAYVLGADNVDIILHASICVAISSLRSIRRNIRKQAPLETNPFNSSLSAKKKQKKKKRRKSDERKKENRLNGEAILN